MNKVSMFQSATLKLTGWYLLILMIISITFSFVIYETTSTEVGNRLAHFQTSLERDPAFGLPPPNNIRLGETRDAATNIAVELLYANLFIVIAGGAGSYLLARRTLKPIERAHEAQSRFTSDASHELRTPLSAMKAEIEVVLRDKNSNKEELREILVSNLEEVEKLSQLSEMLLTLSKLDHDKLEKKLLSLNDVAQEAIRRFAVGPERLIVNANKNIRFEGNEAAVRELLCVLIDNALKYSPAESLVTIVLSTQQQFARFEITNTGAGIAPETLPHIFDRFYRADSSRTSGDQKGYGLGLSLAKRIVELHEGELSVSSEINHRTTFLVLLPQHIDLQAKNQK